MVSRVSEIVLLIMILCLLTLIAVRHTFGETGRDTTVSILMDGIVKLQPYYYHEERERVEAFRLAHAISAASKIYDIDPLIALAVARRESSLLPAVGSGRVRGGGGLDVGYFQVRAGSAAERHCGRCVTGDIECNARIGLCWLSYARSVCGSDPWLYIGGYGRGRCPSNRGEAVSWSEIRIARNFFCEIVENCEEVWDSP